MTTPQPKTPATSEIAIGSLVLTVLGEIDQDEHDQERSTAAGTIGYLSGQDDAGNWDLLFPNGAWVKPAAEELLNRSQYRIVSPCALASAIGDMLQGLGLTTD